MFLGFFQYLSISVLINIVESSTLNDKPLAFVRVGNVTKLRQIKHILLKQVNICNARVWLRTQNIYPTDKYMYVKLCHWTNT